MLSSKPVALNWADLALQGTDGSVWSSGSQRGAHAPWGVGFGVGGVGDLTLKGGNLRMSSSQ